MMAVWVGSEEGLVIVDAEFPLRQYKLPFSVTNRVANVEWNPVPGYSNRLLTTVCPPHIVSHRATPTQPPHTALSLCRAGPICWCGIWSTTSRTSLCGDRSAARSGLSAMHT